MQWTDKIRQVKIWLVIVAILIAGAALLASHYLVRDLQTEERNKMEVWAKAMEALNQEDEMSYLLLVAQVMEGNNTIPVIVLDSKDHVMDYRNISIAASEDSMAYVADYGRRLHEEGNYVRIDGDVRDLGDGEIKLDKKFKHTIEVVVDRVVVRENSLRPSVGHSYFESDGMGGGIKGDLPR